MAELSFDIFAIACGNSAPAPAPAPEHGEREPHVPRDAAAEVGLAHLLPQVALAIDSLTNWSLSGPVLVQATALLVWKFSCLARQYLDDKAPPGVSAQVAGLLNPTRDLLTDSTLREILVTGDLGGVNMDKLHALEDIFTEFFKEDLSKDDWALLLKPLNWRLPTSLPTRSKTR